MYEVTNLKANVKQFLARELRSLTYYPFELSIFAVFHDPGVAISVGYKEVSGGFRHRHRGGHAKVVDVTPGFKRSSQDKIRAVLSWRKL